MKIRFGLKNCKLNRKILISMFILLMIFPFYGCSTSRLIPITHDGMTPYSRPHPVKSKNIDLVLNQGALLHSTSIYLLKDSVYFTIATENSSGDLPLVVEVPKVRYFKTPRTGLGILNGALLGTLAELPLLFIYGSKMGNSSSEDLEIDNDFKGGDFSVLALLLTGPVLGGIIGAHHAPTITWTFDF